MKVGKTCDRWDRRIHLAAVLVTSSLLVACGGGSVAGSTGVALPPAGGASAAAPSAPTLKEQIAALEQSGAYPKLDRSADIAGPDANSNGVRDDIEVWINSQQLSEAQRRVLMQRAKALQKALLVRLDDRAALQVTGEGLMASSNCSLTHFTPYATFLALAGQIEAMTANTGQRAERYMKYNAARSGTSTTLPNGNTCEP